MTRFITLITIILVAKSMVLAQNEVLDRYIKMGVENNLSVTQKQIELQQRHAALKMAKAEFLPTIDFNARYTKATGGRSFEIPTGDLMNPVYSTLNGIVGENQFPEIGNQELNFNRTTDVQTQFTLSQMLFDKRLSLSKSIVEQQVKSDYEEVAIEKRSLVAEIKKGYYNYLKSLSVLELLESTKDLATENYDVSQSLYQNDKVTQDVVWRAKSDLSGIDFQIAEANKNLAVTASYFNFLLNRPLDSTIEVDSFNLSIPEVISLEASPDAREEWKQLEIGKQANELNSKLVKSNNLPNLYAVVDYGFQGTSYQFNTEADYTLASLVLSWNIFNGGKNKAHVQKIKLENQRLATQQRELEQSIQLEVIQAYHSIRAATQNRQTSFDREKDASETYRLINRKFKEGMAAQVELVDARHNLTIASLQKIIAHYDLWSAYADYERANASYSFNY